jgi:hypothetical protein
VTSKVGRDAEQADIGRLGDFARTWPTSVGAVRREAGYRDNLPARRSGAVDLAALAIDDGPYCRVVTGGWSL